MKPEPPKVRVRFVDLKPEREDAFARAWETILRLGREARERGATAPAEVAP